MTELNLCKKCQSCYCKDEYCNECNELINEESELGEEDEI